MISLRRLSSIQTTGCILIWGWHHLHRQWCHLKTGKIIYTDNGCSPKSKQKIFYQYGVSLTMLKWSSIRILYTGNLYSLPLVSSFKLKYNFAGAGGQRNQWVVLHLGTSCVPPWHCEIGLFCPFVGHYGAHKVTFVRYWGTLRFVSPNERGLIDSRLLNKWRVSIKLSGAPIGFAGIPWSTTML